MNLVNTTLGAGMMALPFAFARLGLGVGAIALFLCGWLTAFSLVGLVKASVRSQRLASYADLVKHSFGQRGSSLLQFAIVANNAGSLVIYLVRRGRGRIFIVKFSFFLHYVSNLHFITDAI